MRLRCKETQDPPHLGGLAARERVHGGDTAMGCGRVPAMVGGCCGDVWSDFLGPEL